MSENRVESRFILPTYDLNIVKKVRFLYIKDSLTNLERKLLYFILFKKSRCNLLEVARELKCTLATAHEVDLSLNNKLIAAFNNTSKFKKYFQMMKVAYGNLIYDMDLSFFENTYQNKSYGELLAEFSNNNITLSEEDKECLRIYSNYFNEEKLSKRDIEKDIYLASFGYKTSKKILDIPSLYHTFLTHKEEFSSAEVLFLECYIFSNDKEKRKYFRMQYPASNLPTMHKTLINKLELLHYDLKNLFEENFFDRECYIHVRTKFPNNITKRRKLLLDCYYGVEREKLSFEQIAEFLGEDKQKIKIEIYTAIEYLDNLYNSNTKELIFNKDIYISFIMDERYEFTTETRQALRFYLLDNLNYHEIAEKMSLNLKRVASIINDGLRRIDYYRFGIINPEIIEPSLLAEFFSSPFCSLNEISKKIVCLKKGKINSNNFQKREFKNDVEICTEFGINKKQLSRIIVKFNSEFLKFRVRNVELRDFDIIEEVDKELFDSVITENEKRIISLYFGLTNKYNLEGIKYSKTEISKLLKMDIGTIGDNISRVLTNIKARKINIIRPDLLYIELNKLDIILKDKHLPITKEQKELIKCLFGLDGYSVMTLEELAVLRKNKAKHVKREYQRAIITIYKYLNKEIEGIFDYDTEIVPNLRYFSNRDSAFILEYFNEGLTYELIAKKHNLKIDYITNRMLHLKNILRALIKGKVNRRFDFELYRELVNCKELPFYGDLALIKNCFDLYTGETTYENLSIPEIIKRLRLSCREKNIRSNMQQLIISIYKLKNGIRKPTTFTKDNILECFLKNAVNMDNERLKKYKDCLKQFEDGEVTIDVDEDIIFDLLKESNPEYCNLETISFDEVNEIVNKYGDLLEEATKKWLIKTYNINKQPKEHFSNTEKALRLLKLLPKT